MERIAIIYPHLTTYFVHTLKDFADSNHIQLDVLYGPIPFNLGFHDQKIFEHPLINWIQVEEKHPFGSRLGMYQSGVLDYVTKRRPDTILIWSNPRYLSFWSILIAGYVLRLRVFPRGHGLFKKKRVGLFHNLMYRLILALSYKYICYTPAVRESLRPLVRNDEKLAVDFNTLTNYFPIKPDQKKGVELGIFYLGRVRGNCGVDVLIDVVRDLNQDNHHNIELHIIGDGPLGSYIREKASIYSWLRYYGAVYDEKLISDISMNCRFGCVPGFMGLNAVHMFSLSLPVITHGDLPLHGPEPEYIRHKWNGWLIDKPNNHSALRDALNELWSLPGVDLRTMQKNAYDTYEQLHTPPYHERLLNILEAS